MVEKRIYKSSKKGELMGLENPEEYMIPNFTPEEELKKYGYDYLFKIVTRSNDREDIYIKCVNPRGQYVYVLIDDNRVPIQNNDLQYMETKETFIPLSFKAGIMDCAELGICGVAFDCKDSMCVINLDDTLKPVEKTFKILTERPEKVVVSEGEIIPYPIITLNEIRYNPDEILSICDAIVKNIRRDFFVKIEKNLDVLKCNVDMMKQKVEKCYSFLKETECKLKDSFCQLEEFDDFFAKNPPTLEENKCKHRLIKYNLRKTNESFVEFVNLNSSLYGENIKIVETLNKMDDYLRICEKEFSCAGYVKSDTMEV